MTRFDAYEIAQRCGERELLIQTAEECSELAQACCKLLRVLDGKTPVPEKQARAALVEELADVHVTMQALEWRVLTIDERVTMNITEDEKLDRWRRRIEAAVSQEAPLGAGAQNPAADAKKHAEADLEALEMRGRRREAWW